MRKHSTQGKVGFLRPLRIPPQPFLFLSMDFMLRFLKVKDKYNCKNDGGVLYEQMDDIHSNSKTSDSGYDCGSLLWYLDRHRSRPWDIIINRNSQFDTAFRQYVIRKLKINLKMNFAFHPQTNAQIKSMCKSSRWIQSSIYIWRCIVGEQRIW